jgi:hypothetical protein
MFFQRYPLSKVFLKPANLRNSPLTAKDFLISRGLTGTYQFAAVTNSQERGRPAVFSIGVHPRSLGALIVCRFLRRRSRREETRIVYRKFARGRQALLGRCVDFIWESCLSNFRVELRRQRRKQASHYPFSKALWHPLDSRSRD